MPIRIHNEAYLLKYRKLLRNDGTPAEAVLWTSLSRKQLFGRKFRRQHSIKGMIVDFYCPAERLIIELDGDAHETASGQADDAHRDEQLKQMKFTVLRYENKEVFDHLESLLQDIVQHFRRPPPSSSLESVNHP